MIRTTKPVTDILTASLPVPVVDKFGCTLHVTAVKFIGSTCYAVTDELSHPIKAAHIRYIMRPDSA